MKANTKEDFWRNVSVTGECWEWKGTLYKNGYGRFHFENKSHRAHRLAWSFANGEIPTGIGYHGTCVLHKCDNRKCVNPAHLFLGTVEENNKDKAAKGRSLKGEQHPMCKVSDSDVLQIRADERPQSQISREFGISPAQVSNIKNLRTRQHLIEDKS